MDGARVSGAAMRRRERRLRSWAKHERMTVAMALAENLHHSRQKVEGGVHVGPRAQKTARATGARPGVLTEPEPQVGAVTVGYVAAPVPLVSSPILAGGDATDDVTVAFLVAAALEEKKDEEEKARVRRQREAAEHEARMRELDRRVQNNVPLSPAESRAWLKWARHLPPKKRKKRRKRETSSQLFTLAWPRHLGRYGPEGHLCRDTETASVARAVYALGNLDFLRATGIWHPVRCLSCRRNTGKFGVFWEFTTRHHARRHPWQWHMLGLFFWS